MRSLVVLLLLGAVASADVDPDAPSVRLEARDAAGNVVLAPTTKVGEPFQLAVVVIHRPEVGVSLPASFDAGTFEVLDRRETKTPAGERQFELTVVAWKTGKQPFPPVPITYVARGQALQVSTAGIDVTVEATLGEGQGAEPALPPVTVYERDPTIMRIVIGAGIAALLVAVGLVVAFSWRVRARRIAAQAPVVVDSRPPDEIALAKLRTLAASGLMDKPDRRPFYFAVTEIVREYLGRRYGFDALELTTSELLAKLRETDATQTVRAEIEFWLLDCDMVKYAAVPVGREQAQGSLDGAVSLVERARPPRPVPTEGVAAGG
jgi:hypothetical protein